MKLQTIPLVRLLFAFLPVLLVLFIFLKWSLKTGRSLYALLRMLSQLLLVGYFLTYLFESDSAFVVIGIASVMMFSSSWIALGSVSSYRKSLYKFAVLSIAVGGVMTLLFITQGVLHFRPWYWPRYMIPFAGMIFANSMNSVSLGAERMIAEMERDVPYLEARNIAFQASLIPITNSLLAVGLVSIPGMMTGQILSGVSPLVAARYQIMVMCMIFGSSGIASACFLHFSKATFVRATAKTQV